MKNFIKKNVALFCVLVLIISLSFFFSKLVDLRVSKLNGITIVLDAGHGGRDGGSVGVLGTVEKKINLEYVFALKDKLVNHGYKVILTRKNDDGLYSVLSKNKKQSDMKERLKIIKKANPNLVISIHMNSFCESSARGATTYHREGDVASSRCGDLIQKSLKAYCGARSEKSKVGDYFMVNSSYYTAVLVECGFLSNPQEEKQLNTKEYKDKITEAIFKGVLLYFGNKEI